MFGKKFRARNAATTNATTNSIGSSNALPPTRNTGLSRADYSYERTVFGGGVALGATLPFNAYVGAEISLYYGNAAYYSFVMPGISDMMRLWYTNHHLQAALNLVLGYDIELGANFFMRPHIGYGRLVRFYDAVPSIALPTGSRFSERPMTLLFQGEAFAGLLTAYRLNERLMLGLHLRTNLSAALTAQLRW